MELWCPPFTIPSGGECLPAFTGGSSVSTEMVFSFNVSSAILVSAFTLHQTVLVRLKKELSSRNIHCQICNTTLGVDYSKSVSYLIVKVQLTDSCKYQALVEFIRHHLSHTIHVSIASNGFESKLAISPSPDEALVTLSNLTYLHTHKLVKCQTLVRFDLSLEDVFICPAIFLPRTQLESLQITARAIQRLKNALFPLHYGADSLANKTDLVTICVDEYRELVHRALHNSGLGINTSWKRSFITQTIGILLIISLHHLAS